MLLRPKDAEETASRAAFHIWVETRLGEEATGRGGRRRDTRAAAGEGRRQGRGPEGREAPSGEADRAVLQHRGLR